MTQSKLNITQREQDVLHLLAKGYSDREIAEHLVLSVGTVKWYNRQIYNKLNVSNRTEAVIVAHEKDLLQANTHNKQESPSHHIRSLPSQLTSFIGRKHEIQTLTELLLNGTRLITLTGAPGVGKTRLALETAATITDVYSDGVYFIPLAPIHETDLIPGVIAQALKIAVSGATSPMITLIDYLSKKQMLLVLDNYEHLLSGASLVSELLKTAPHLAIIVTSRETLRLYGEYEFSVPPLQLPDLKQSFTVETLQSYEAVDLLIQRTQMVVPGFAMDNDNASAVATICVHLDGLPLAIELAAARMRFYAPQTLLLRLGSRLNALRDGPRDLPDRQRTLRATLAWSYELLNKEEQSLFARLGVFVGGCTHAAVEAICEDDLKASIAEGLESLLLKNLIQQDHLPGGERRFTMLETMREFALEKLAEQNALSTIRQQHAQHFTMMTAEATSAAYGSHEAQWLDWLDAEHDNLRATLEWSLNHDPTAQLSFQLISNLARFWELKGYLTEGRNWFERANTLPEANRSTKLYADAMLGVGDIAYIQCEYDATYKLYNKALKIYRKLNDEIGVAHALLGLGEVATEVGDYDIAPEHFQEAYAIMQRFDDSSGCARALTQLGWGALRVGDLEQAHTHLEKGLSLYQILDDKVGIALTNSGLGEVAIRRDEYDVAIQFLETSLHLRKQLDQKWGIAVSLGSLAWVAIRQNKLHRATQLLRESLIIRHEIGDMGGLAWCLEKKAEISLLEKNATKAVHILGAASALRTHINSTIDPCDKDHYEEIIKQLKRDLGNDKFKDLWSKAQEMTVEQIIQYTSI